MRRISIDKRFVENNNLIPEKIHTIRKNFDFWKKFEGKELSLFTWQGKPYQKGSKQKIICVKKLIYVQPVYLHCQVMTENGDKALPEYYAFRGCIDKILIDKEQIAENDGFSCADELRRLGF